MPDYFKYIQHETSNINIVNNYCQAINKSIEIQCSDNFIQAITNSYYYLGQYYIINHKISEIDFTNNLNIFNIVPDYLFEYCNILSNETKYDFFTCLMGILGITSIAMNGKYQVEIKTTWIENVLLYQLFLDPTGDKINVFINWLKESLNIEMNNSQKEFDRLTVKEKFNSRIMLNLLNNSIKNDTKTIFKESKLSSGSINYELFISKFNSLTNEHNNLKDNFEIILNKKRPLLFIDDTSPRGLLNLMKEYSTLAICGSESTIINKLENENNNQELFNLILRSYNAESFYYASDSSNNNFNIEYPRLNILLGYQIDRLSNFFKCKRNLNSGLIAMFLPIFISRNINAINIQQDIEQINAQCFNELKYDFRRKILTIFRNSLKLNSPCIIYLSPEAKHSFDNISQTNFGITQYTYKYMEMYRDKFLGTLARLACILFVLDPNKRKKYIDITHMDLAHEIILNLLKHADFAVNPTGLQSIELATTIEDWYQPRNISVFEYSDAKRACNSHYSREQIVAALNLLCAQHHLVMIPGPKRTDHYVVHPGLVTPSLPENYRYHFQADSFRLHQQFLLNQQFQQSQQMKIKPPLFNDLSPSAKPTSSLYAKFQSNL
jgi:hypothetical protein